MDAAESPQLERFLGAVRAFQIRTSFLKCGHPLNATLLSTALTVLDRLMPGLDFFRRDRGGVSRLVPLVVVVVVRLWHECARGEATPGEACRLVLPQIIDLVSRGARQIGHVLLAALSRDLLQFLLV